MSTMPEAGQKAPQFNLPDETGTRVKLSDFKGKKVAIYFYPEDDTPTCNQQACNLRDHFEDLSKNGITVVGISPNTMEEHKRFRSKFNLPFILLADPEMKAIQAYGVWGEKVLYGRHYMGLKRSTFLVNEKGLIHAVIPRALSKIHHKQILKAWDLI